MNSYLIKGEFTDVHTGEKYLPNQKKQFSKERAAEILKVDKLIELIPEEPEKPKEAAAKPKK
jgi:hypothetical protein